MKQVNISFELCETECSDNPALVLQERQFRPVSGILYVFVFVSPAEHEYAGMLFDRYFVPGAEADYDAITPDSPLAQFIVAAIRSNLTDGFTTYWSGLMPPEVKQAINQFEYHIQSLVKDTKIRPSPLMSDCSIC